MWDATPLAKAAAIADPRPQPKTVASFDAPNVLATRCAIRAGGSSDPVRAEPSQSRTVLCVSSITAAGRSAGRSAERCPASIVVTASDIFLLSTQRPNGRFVRQGVHLRGDENRSGLAFGAGQRRPQFNLCAGIPSGDSEAGGHRHPIDRPNVRSVRSIPALHLLHLDEAQLAIVEYDHPQAERF